MPVFAADVLPDTTGRNLGSPPQRWNLFAQNLDIQGNINYQPIAGATIGVIGVVHVATSLVSANANSTGAQLLQNCVIPAGLLNAPGMVLRVTMAGTYTTQSGQTPALSLAVVLGNRPVFGTTTGLSAAVAGADWSASLVCVVYQPGSAAVLTPFGTMLFQASDATNIATPLISIYDSVSPIDLTVDETLACEWSFSTNTSPANNATQRTLIVEVLN